RAGRRDEAVGYCRSLAERKGEDEGLRARGAYFHGLALMDGGSFGEAAERFSEVLRLKADEALAGRARLLVAQCHHRSGSIDEARRGYDAVIASGDAGTVGDATYGLAILHEQQGRAAEAGALLDELLKKGPEKSLAGTAKLHRGRAWFDEGQFDRASAMFSEVAKEDSELAVEAEYWMAKCRMRQGGFAEAAAQLGELLKASPDGALAGDMLYDRGVALYRADERDAAVGALESYVGRFEDGGMVADAVHLLAIVEHQRARYDRSGEWCATFFKRFESHGLGSSVAFLAAENLYMAGAYADAGNGFEAFLTRYGGDERAEDARFRLGMARFRTGQHESAEAVLTEFAKGKDTAEPRRAALSALGTMAFERGDWSRAARHLDDYLATGAAAGADDVLLKLGLCRERLGRHDEAIAAFDRLLEQFAESVHRVHAVFERGQCLTALGRVDEARSAFEQVVAAGEETRFHAFAQNHLATIAMQQGDFRAAGERFASVRSGSQADDLSAGAMLGEGQAMLAGQRFAEAERVLREFAERYPEHEGAARARAQRAIAVARQDRCAEAMELIGHIDRSAIESMGTELRDAIGYESAWCLRTMGRTEEAAKVYGELVTSGHEGRLSVHAAVDLASIEASAGRHERVVELLRPVFETFRTGGKADAALRERVTYQLGVSEFQLGRFAEAATRLEEMLEATPEGELSVSGRYFCGEALMKLGRLERAVVHLKRVVDSAPADELHPAAMLRLGECEAGLQHWSESERVFTGYLARFGDRAEWYQAQFGVGWARENQKRYDEAVGAYGEVVARHQGATAARAQFQIGECLFAKNEHASAAAELMKVDILYAYPEWSAAALYEAGRCFEKMSQESEARDRYREVVERFSGSEWARLAGERLGKSAGAGVPGR
ncbi:MAG: tetratricopeptide repeat protein, partial [Phycisphaerales bacterium]|nr:tetratricopeptide repeat protein [Phycisphaerales bacterium]